MDNIIDKVLTALLAVAVVSFVVGAVALMFAGVVALWFQAHETASLAARIGLGSFVITFGTLFCGGAGHKAFNRDNLSPPSIF
jgi:uncharacterized membrane protein